MKRPRRIERVLKNILESAAESLENAVNKEAYRGGFKVFTLLNDRFDPPVFFFHSLAGKVSGKRISSKGISSR